MNSKMRILIPVLVLVLVAVTGDPAQAGLFGKSKKYERTEKDLKAWRYDRLPTMSFASGTVSRSAFTGWEMDNVQIQLKKDCAIIGHDGEPARLQDGNRVMIMGSRVGDTIVAWQIRVLKPHYGYAKANSQVNVQWSDVDPTVGEGTGPE